METNTNYDFDNPDRPSLCTWTPCSENSPHDQSCSMDTVKKHILPNILHAIGQTPMVKLNRIPKLHGIKCDLLAKCEFMNPGGSVKDRIGIRMIVDAEKKYWLKPGYTIIAVTSGNTGIAIALAASVKGYKCIIVMSDRFADEKVHIMKTLGAEIVRTPIHAEWNSPAGPHAVAQQIHQRIPQSVIINQFTNPSNPLAHYDTTAREIIQQCYSKVDYVVGGIGTGGTITGIARLLRNLLYDTKIIVAVPTISHYPRVDPEDQLHHVEGIGINFKPPTTDFNLIDHYVNVDEHECFKLAKDLARYEGLLCGISSGAALCAALKIAKTLPAEARIVILLPDTVRNYTNKLLNDSWMEWKYFENPPMPLGFNEWWWYLTVYEAIPIESPKLLGNSLSCKHVLKYFQKSNIHEMAVDNDKNDILGFVNLNYLLSSLVSGRVREDQSIITVANTKFKRVPKSITLGRLSRIIEHSSYAVVYDENENNALLGVINQGDIYNFISRYRSKHQYKQASYSFL